MNEHDPEHPYLPVPEPQHATRTFMGGTSLRARATLFILFGLIALVAFGAVTLHVDQRVARDMKDLDRAQAMIAQTTKIERGIADLRSLEKQYLLTREGGLAEDMRTAMAETSQLLDRLAASPEADSLDQPIATLRDGLIQYDQHFTAIGARSAKDSNGLRGKVRDANAALEPRIKTLKRQDLEALLARANQVGSEMVLTGDPKGLDDLQTTYRDLFASVDKGKLPKADKASVSDLLTSHQTAMMALITARVNLNEDAQRFEDIQAYMKPSLGNLQTVAAEVHGERSSALEETRLFAAYTLAGGGAAVILWTLIIGFLVIRSVTAPMTALARAAGELASGERMISVPARGNKDATGALARAFDDWVSAVAEAEHLRQDLDHARVKAERAVTEAEREAERADNLSRQAAEAQKALEKQQTDMEQVVRHRLADALAVQRKVEAPATGDAVVLAGGPARDCPEQSVITDISGELARYSERASAAVNGVERADTVVRGVDAAMEQLDLLATYVVAIRDQTNFLLFGGPREATSEEASDRLVVLDRDLLARDPLDRESASGIGQGSNQGQGDGREAPARGRLDALRTAAERGERVLAAARDEVEAVSRVAEKMSTSASAEAKQATARLLARSAQLQTLLNEQGVSGTEDKKAEDKKPRALVAPVQIRKRQ